MAFHSSDYPHFQVIVNDGNPLGTDRRILLFHWSGFLYKRKIPLPSSGMALVGGSRKYFTFLCYLLSCYPWKIKNLIIYPLPESTLLSFPVIRQLHKYIPPDKLPHCASGRYYVRVLPCGLPYYPKVLPSQGS